MLSSCRASEARMISTRVAGAPQPDLARLVMLARHPDPVVHDRLATDTLLVHEGETLVGALLFRQTTPTLWRAERANRCPSQRPIQAKKRKGSG